MLENVLLYVLQNLEVSLHQDFDNDQPPQSKLLYNEVEFEVIEEQQFHN